MDFPTISARYAVTDPMPTAQLQVLDPGSAFSFSPMQSIVIIDETGQSNPTHNILMNPSINNVSPLGYIADNTAGGTITNLFPGARFTVANNGSGVNTDCFYHQVTQQGYVVPGQKYMLSAYVNVTVNMTGTAQAVLKWNWLDAAGTFLSGGGSLLFTNTGGVQVRKSVSATAPANTASADIYIGILVSSATNAGTVEFTTLQFEPMWFVNQGVAYPTPDNNPSQATSTQLPDTTTVRQTRLYAGYITRTDLTYDGPNRTWTLTCASNSLLLETFLTTSSVANTTNDASVISATISNNYQTNFATTTVLNASYTILTQNGVVGLGATIDYAQYADMTFKDILAVLANSSGYFYYVDEYFDLKYAPPGFTQATFGLSDVPNTAPTDGSLPTYAYYNYQVTVDGTQIKNRIKVLGGKFNSGPISDTFTGDGATKKFNLTQPPVSVSTVTVNAVSKTRVGVEGQDTLAAGVPVVYSASGQYVNFFAAPPNGQAVVVTYQYLQTAVVRVRDVSSIATYNLVFDTIVNDTALISVNTCYSRGLAELIQGSNARTIIRLATAQRLVAGMMVQLTSSLDSFTRKPFLVQRVQMKYLGNGIYEYQCELGAYNPNLAKILANIHKVMNRNTSGVTTPILQENVVVIEQMSYVDSAKHP